MKPYLLALCAVQVVGLSGCVLGPSPLYSRLPAQQHQQQVPVLSQEERQRYDQIDRQVLADQQQRTAFDTAAQAYRPVVPVTIYGGYGGYGGWGNRWNVGYGVGYRPYW